MIKKLIILLLGLFILMSTASAIDSSNWTNATVGYETFKIPPQYENPYQSDFHMYDFDEDIDVFTIRFVNPNIMSLYGYYMEQNSHIKKVKIAGHDAVHFMSYDDNIEKNKSKLWFSSGEEFYYISWLGENITPEIKEVVKSCSDSKFSHDEFYDILSEEFKNYKIVNAIESQRNDYPQDNRHHSFFSVGTNGYSVGVMN